MSCNAAFIVQPGAVQRVERDVAEAAIGQGGFVYIHIDGTAPGNREWLASLGLDHIAINALLAAETRPRVEMIDGAVIVNLRGLALEEDAEGDLLASIRLCAARELVISTAMRPLKALAPLFAEVAGGALRDPGDLMAATAQLITGELDPEVAELGDQLDDAEEHLDGERALAMRGEIARVRSRAIIYRRFMAPQRAALDKLAAARFEWLNDDDRLHLNEAADRAARMVEELEAIRERAALMHEQLTDLRAELLDTRGLLLSIVALIFLPLTFLTGLLGMNVEGIPFAKEPWAFWGVVGFCALMAAGITGYFMMRRWTRN